MILQTILANFELLLTRTCEEKKLKLKVVEKGSLEDYLRTILLNVRLAQTQLEVKNATRAREEKYREEYQRVEESKQRPQKEAQ